MCWPIIRQAEQEKEKKKNLQGTYARVWEITCAVYETIDRAALDYYWKV